MRLMLVITLTFLASLSYAQFYNGMNMEFGKNRVQWKDFHWSYLKYETFDVYFYQGGNELANYVLNYAKDEIPEMALDAIPDEIPDSMRDEVRSILIRLDQLLNQISPPKARP